MSTIDKDCPCCYPCTGGDFSSSDNQNSGEDLPYVPEPSWTEFIRGQELLSTIDEKFPLSNKCLVTGNSEVVWERDVQLMRGDIVVLHVPHEDLKCGTSDASIYPFTWENSNSTAVLLQPPQSLSQAQVMALEYGQARITATCTRCGCQKVYAWNIEVLEGDKKEKEEGEENKPSGGGCGCTCDCESTYPSDLDTLRDDLCNGGDVEYLGPKKYLDLFYDEITIDGVDSSLTLGKKVTLSGDNGVFHVVNQGCLKIEGEGKIISGADQWRDSGYGLMVDSSAEAEILGGHWITENPKAPIVISNGGKVTIRGGVFEGKLKEKELLELPWGMRGVAGIDPLEYIEVKGGRWIGWSPSLYVPQGWEIGHVEGKDEYLVEEYFKHPRGKEVRGGEIINWPSYLS